MIRILVLVLLLLSAQFSATVFAPAKAGTAWLLWPFAENTRSWIGIVGGMKRSASPLTLLLAGAATLCFLVAALSLFGIGVPVDLWPPLVLAATAASILLHALFIGIWALVPLAIDFALL